MRILFVHQNFPGQFKHLAPALARRPGFDVRALVLQQGVPPQWEGVRLHTYQTTRGSTPGIHPWVGDIETKAIRGEAAFRAALALRDDGFVPDLIIAHPGWGESLFLKEVWPRARLAIYSELFYHTEGADVGFDPEFTPPDPAYRCRLQLKNAGNLLQFQSADAGISPTHWQADSFPAAFRDKITVIHDGIDCDAVAPNQAARLTLNGNLPLSCDDEIITFVNRNLEPYRGYHVFMRALPELLRRRPKARVLIVGGDGVSYGAPPPEGQSWKAIYLNEIRPQLADAELERVHFLGRIAYDHFIALLQISTVHVYLSYPFVLSWSLLEAMSAGCAIVASDTAPVREAIRSGETGLLVDFFDRAGLVDAVCGLLDMPAERARLGTAARAHARHHYDLRTVCLPAQLAWAMSLLENPRHA
jgi:glycosyltransferase involved in cell wall biosynthesis